MSTTSKMIILVGVLVVAVLALAAQFIPASLRGVDIPDYTINAGEVTRDVLVGQTFTAPHDNLAGVSVMFANYSNRNNTKPVQLHLRESIDSPIDLRTAEVSATELGDNQFHRFTFEPIVDSGGKQFFFFIVSPESVPGNAVTVDLNSQDPYHLGTAFVIRNRGPNVTDPDLLARSGKQTLDVVFATHHEVPLRAAVLQQGRKVVRTFVVTWDDSRGEYFTWLRLLLPVLVFIVLLLSLRGDSETETSLRGRWVVSLLLGLFVAAILFRLFYATTLPLTNDEGNYLYDARTLLQGQLAGGDGYVKAPLVIAWIAVWQLVVGDTLFAGRLSSIVAGSLTLFPLYLIGAVLWSRRAGIMVAATWALLGATTVFNIYVHTQSVALLFGISGVALLAAALTNQVPRKDGSRLGWYFLVGVLLGLGVASRKSMLALGLAPLLLIIIQTKSWQDITKRLVVVGLGFALVIGLLLGWGYWLYGQEGIREVIGLNSAEDSISAATAEEFDQVRAYNIRGMTPFFRESLPFILFGLLGWGFAMESLGRGLIRRGLQKKPGRSIQFFLEHMLPKLVWVAPLAVFVWAWQFFWEYEGGIFLSIGAMQLLWYVLGVVLLLAALWPRPLAERFEFEEEGAVEKSKQPGFTSTYAKNRTSRKKLSGKLPNVSAPVNTVAGVLQKWSDKIQVEPTKTKSEGRTWRTLLSVSLVLPAWLLGLVVFYVSWIKFHANYIVEFLVPLTILAGIGAYVAWRRVSGRKSFAEAHPVWAIGQHLLALGFLGVLVWTMYLSNYITYTYEHTGTFNQGAINEAAVWAQENIPFDEPIFTGAAAVPYVSGHRTALDIAHPRWYAYEFTRTNTERLNTFLPAVEEMLEAYRSANWFLLERQTGFSFLMEYSEIEAGLATDWEVVHEVENGSNTLTFYRRLAQPR